MKSAVNYKANLLINQSLREFNSQEKENALNKYLNLNDDKIFYIASKHGDCAKDHLKAQGKIYVNAKYKNIVKDKEIDKFITQNGFLPVQEITGAPTYFITRPHCRHYFIRKSYKDIINGNYKIPTSKIGERYYATQQGGNYDYYADRLTFLKKLYAEKPNAKLKNLITKTKMLKDKWKDM